MHMSQHMQVYICYMYVSTHLEPKQVHDEVSQILRILLLEQVANNLPE